MNPPDPRMNGLQGGVLLGGAAREYRITVPREYQQMIKFLAAAAGCTEGDMAQRLLMNSTDTSFVTVVGKCVQGALEAARDTLMGLPPI